ncbi:SDR family NAD(P)-dependent oxidoreductase [Gorillibacterium sp. sgz5001074]|uniref:SDR family NAD(P)-dependent oxidoreductase n=1 Tax=Gorillibacterium sp. sgz5001074 TaxID=3446695 RepID=UPI003F681D8E
MNTTQPTALITGASGGIGLELAKLFARDGYALVLAARSEEALKRLAGELETTHGTRTLIIPADLSDPAAPAQLFEETERAGITVDVLVNNAGFAVFGPFAEADAKDTMDMIQVNVNALTHLTRLYTPGMVARRGGRILNVASTAAFQPGPLMAVYFATKAFVLSFSEAIAHELKPSGVTVTALCPGPTKTGFEKRAKMEGSKLFQGRVMAAADAARAGYEALMKGEPLVIPGAGNRLLASSVRFMPRRLVPALVQKFQEKS